MAFFDAFLNSQPEEKIRKSVANSRRENSQAICEFPAKEDENSQLSQLSQPSKPENECSIKLIVKDKVYLIENYRDSPSGTQLESTQTEIQVSPAAKVANPANFANPPALRDGSPAFDEVRLQREADRRNATAMRAHSTDRWCACGQLATFAWPTGRGRENWRCLECAPVTGGRKQ